MHRVKTIAVQGTMSVWGNSYKLFLTKKQEAAMLAIKTHFSVYIKYYQLPLILTVLLHVA